MIIISEEVPHLEVHLKEKERERDAGELQHKVAGTAQLMEMSREKLTREES